MKEGRKEGGRRVERRRERVEKRGSGMMERERRGRQVRENGGMDGWTDCQIGMH